MPEDKVLKKLREHDGRFIKIDKSLSSFEKRFKNIDGKFEQVDKRFEQVNKRFEQVNKRFEQVDKRFEQVNKRFDRVEGILLNHDIKFDQLNEKIDRIFTELSDKIATSSDQILTIVRRLDQERVFTFAKVQELELKMKNQSKEITKIKKVLKIV